jgi:lysozyme
MQPIDTTDAESLGHRFEGFRHEPYLCPAKVPTIGYGSTFYEDGRRVTMSDPPILESRAQELFKHTLIAVFLPQLLRLCPQLVVDYLITNNPARINAILDFVYNLGPGNLQISTLRKRILSERWNDVPIELRKWNKGGGRVLRGLTLRREAEVVVWNKAL